MSVAAARWITRRTAPGSPGAPLAPAPRAVCFWTGAGISLEAPSCLPLGEALTWAVIRGAFGGITEHRLRAEFGRAGSAGRRERGAPALEPVLECLAAVIGRERVEAALAPLAGAAPNALHEFFARHVAEGGDHVTVRLDRGVEQLLDETGAARRPLALHGAFGQRRHVGRLARPDDLELVSGLRERLAGPHPLSDRFLIVAGYSGRDHGDIDPLMRDLLLEGWRRPRLTVLWLDHDQRQDGYGYEFAWRDTLGTWTPALPHSLAELSGNGARCFRVDVRAYLERLAAAWGWPPLAAAPPLGTTLEGIAAVRDAVAAGFALTPAERAECQASLRGSLGLGTRR